VKGTLLVDTDVMIDLLRGHEAAASWVREHSAGIALSAITVAELYAGFKGDDEKRLLDDLVGLFPVLPISAQVAKQGGLYRQRYRPSHGVGLADALIAATATEHKARLVSLNRKHFPMLDSVETPYRKTH
jgi:predicted nucleic acid-binding protein